MKEETYNLKSKDKKYWRAAGFLQALHRNGVPIDQLMTNDWEHVPSPKVYVAGRAYKRFSDYDFNNALKYWREVAN